ncbi:MAG: radical SAM protein [Candidatus Omnitrophica bacterium]|nr:radical SAM protein [Candidatus Omnitrophota bacterium]
MDKPLAQTLKEQFAFSANKNQLRDIERLVFEIQKRENVPLQTLIRYLKDEPKVEKQTGRNKFFPIKSALMKRRFPLTGSQGTIDAKKVFLNAIKTPLGDNWTVKKDFVPLEIFVEEAVKNSPLLLNFTAKFPTIPVTPLAHYSDYLKSNKFTLKDLKKPLVFIVKEKWDFIKPCPCTKGHLGCGYWIFNTGFGCPFDCSYCFLQHYANFPGMILPANLNDFFDTFNASGLNTLKTPVRIGTGEFCDSLALDEITGYTKELVPFFKNKNVLFELKTKSDRIANLLEMPAASNIVISWSLNPETMVEKEEPGTATLKERLAAAKKMQQKGFRIGFHFDPIIHSQNWRRLYQQTISELYAHVKPGLAWISLGTLRCHRQLKTNAQLRFPDSDIFYGELFLGDDKKLRYPQFLRKEIYSSMIAWIREHDTKTPVYLCMEDNQMWKVAGDKFNTSKDVENYLIPTA